MHAIHDVKTYTDIWLWTNTNSQFATSNIFMLWKYTQTYNIHTYTYKRHTWHGPGNILANCESVLVHSQLSVYIFTSWIVCISLVSCLFAYQLLIICLSVSYFRLSVAYHLLISCLSAYQFLISSLSIPYQFLISSLC